MADRSSCSPLNSRAVRSRAKSRSRDVASRSSSACRSASGSSSRSSTAASRSAARVSRSRQVSISVRRPSASRRTFWASRWSSQNPGSLVRLSSWVTRSCLASRSKTPRGRPDPFGQVADGGGVHLAPGLEILEQDRPQLDEPESRLAPCDDGVHAGAVAVVRADATVAIAVQCGGVTTGPTVPFAGDEIDECCVLGLLHGLPLITALGTGRGGWGVPCRWTRAVRGDRTWHSIGGRSPSAKRVLSEAPCSGRNIRGGRRPAAGGRPARGTSRVPVGR
jgi:hypothetical protein